MDELQKLKEKPYIKSIKDVSEPTQSAFQITFQDGAILIVKSHAYGYDIEYDGLDVQVVEP